MLKKFFVKKLFGIFDNEIEFRKEGITVIVGQNGCGKTTMLHMLDAIFSKNPSKLFRYKFEYIEITFENDVVKIEIDDKSTEEENMRCLKYYINSNELKEYYQENSKINSPGFWCRNISSLRRRPGNMNTVFDLRTGETLSIPEVIDMYFDELSEEAKNDILVIPEEVYELVKDIKVELITTERLKRIYREDEYRRDVPAKYAVEECAEDLSKKLKNVLSEYDNISQKLDEKFPMKLLQAIKKKDLSSIDELEREIKEIDRLREKHIAAGVLEENSDKILNVNVKDEKLEDNTMAVLTVYYQDMKQKLDSLNNISDKIVLLKKILNSKYRKNKKISVNKDAGILIEQVMTKEDIPLKFLSSGEQQELVMLYKLIFKGEKDTIILIDEPEISLNVSWQREFLDDMKEIVDMNKISLIIATHSPQIINDNWELVDTLGEFE